MLTKFKTIAQASKYVGGLSEPGKMPGYCLGLPASKCNVGSKLRTIPNSVCSKCYACKNRYIFGDGLQTRKNRLKALNKKAWVDAMAYLISSRANKIDVFRWHDSGDIQSTQHFENIVEVCNRTPGTKHWLPTKEWGVILKWLKDKPLPSNLCVRLSMPMIKQKPKDIKKLCTSTVDSDTGFKCPVKNGAEGCDTYRCRACWNKKIRNIDYRAH